MKNVSFLFLLVIILNACKSPVEITQRRYMSGYNIQTSSNENKIKKNAASIAIIKMKDLPTNHLITHHENETDSRVPFSEFANNFNPAVASKVNISKKIKLAETSKNTISTLKPIQVKEIGKILEKYSRSTNTTEPHEKAAWKFYLGFFLVVIFVIDLFLFLPKGLFYFPLFFNIIFLTFILLMIVLGLRMLYNNYDPSYL